MAAAITTTSRMRLRLHRKCLPPIGICIAGVPCALQACSAAIDKLIVACVRPACAIAFCQSIPPYDRRVLYASNVSSHIGSTRHQHWASIAQSASVAAFSVMPCGCREHQLREIDRDRYVCAIRFVNRSSSDDATATETSCVSFCSILSSTPLESSIRH